MPFRPRPRCGHCGDVIGVYEPMVLTGDDGERETSLAIEPSLCATMDPCYHRACYVATSSFSHPRTRRHS